MKKIRKPSFKGIRSVAPHLQAKAISRTRGRIVEARTTRPRMETNFPFVTDKHTMKSTNIYRKKWGAEKGERKKGTITRDSRTQRIRTCNCTIPMKLAFKERRGVIVSKLISWTCVRGSEKWERRSMVLAARAIRHLRIEHRKQKINPLEQTYLSFDWANIHMYIRMRKIVKREENDETPLILRGIPRPPTYANLVQRIRKTSKYLIWSLDKKSVDLRQTTVFL